MTHHPRSILDTYGLPHELPVVFRILLLWVLFAGVGFVVWWFAPHGPVLVALLVVYVLAVVFGGLWRIFTARELSRPPGRHRSHRN